MIENFMKRVLVVEDDNEMLEYFVDGIKTLGVIVDRASTKLEALEKIKCRSYHVAMVDIMLTDSHRDRGGFEVIDYINKMNEGTKVVVASASSEVTVPASLIDKNIYSYLVKKHHIKKTEDFLKPIRRALDEVDLNIFGDCRNAVSYLAIPEPYDIWEYTIRSNLDVKLADVTDVLENVFKPILPVLRNKNQLSCLTTNNDKKIIYGQMWSRAIGTAVWICMGKDEDSFIEPIDDLRPEKFLMNNNYKHVKSKIWSIAGTKRSDYFDKMMYARRVTGKAKDGLH